MQESVSPTGHLSFFIPNYAKEKQTPFVSPNFFHSFVPTAPKSIQLCGISQQLSPFQSNTRETEAKLPCLSREWYFRLQDSHQLCPGPSSALLYINSE